ncbi:MAG: sel1 repeat family protein [Chromatiales bacterium]|nr:sel1 repeat family protein [Chromatiales bacterium]
MRHRICQTLLFVCVASLPLPGVAGECRSLLHPLLLQAEPATADIATVRTLCAREADQGDADATYQLALFSLGLGGNWHPDEAVPLIRSAADQGVTEAQYWLAWQSESGPALPHDPAVALSWYEKAAAGRHRLALQRLAEASERGELGLPVDPRKALEYRAQIRRCDEENARASR